MSVRSGAGRDGETVRVRCWQCGEMVWRADDWSVEASEVSGAERVLKGKRRLRFEKREGVVESIQAFVVRERWRRESLVGRGRKERRCAGGKEGESFEWYERVDAEIGRFTRMIRRSKGEGIEADMSNMSVISM